MFRSLARVFLETYRWCSCKLWLHLRKVLAVLGIRRQLVAEAEINNTGEVATLSGNDD